MNVTFARATAADVETLVKLQILAFNDDVRLYPTAKLGGPPGYDSVAATLERINEADFYTIVVDGQIVGGFAVINKGLGHFYLEVIFIDPAYHNRGIGTQAMQFIERTYPAQKWTLNTPDYAIRNHHFYEKFGYVMTRMEVLPEITLRVYEKNL